MFDKYNIAIAVLVLVVVSLLYSMFQNNQQQNTIPVNITPAVSEPVTKGETVTELKIEDEKVGTGAAAVSGKKVTVNYLGTLENGKKFDSSYDRKTPFTFSLGEGAVIKGWDEGIVGMKVGGKRKLTIPSKLGYGERGAGSDIPPNSTLIFEVELLKVE